MKNWVAEGVASDINDFTGDDGLKKLAEIIDFEKWHAEVGDLWGLKHTIWN